MVDIDIRQVVHLLEVQMAGIVEHIAARMVIYPLQETFKSHAIVQILTRMNFIAKIDPLLIV